MESIKKERWYIDYSGFIHSTNDICRYEVIVTDSGDVEWRDGFGYVIESFTGWPCLMSLQKAISGNDWFLYSDFLRTDTFKKIRDIIIKNENNIYPPKDNIFRALELTQCKDVKVIILGQDPYHGEGEANGLAFSVNKGVKLPPSLKNIFIELKTDLNIDRENPDLTDWAKQGILLLNRVLTVEKDNPNSHKDFGWEIFTENIIDIINKRKQNCVFILWGNSAQTVESKINNEKHLIIKSTHPSPLSANKGFFGSKPFSKCDDYLKKNNKKTIIW